MKRLVSTFISAAALIALALPGVATAATGPWSWHDISHRVTYQTQRPIWAMAWDEDGWFYTDGLNLWSGGQVYWFDGQTSSMITLDVRNANIERVDDIVSDRAGTVLFLQDVVRNDNNFRMVAYQNDEYINYTNTVRSAFASDEAISSITGRNGEWMIVTTKGRLFRWYGNATQPQQITLPTTVRNMSLSRSEMLYNVNHGVFQENGSIRLAMVPVQSNAWLLVARVNANDTRVYKYEGSSFSQINEPSDFGKILAVRSNGSEALILAEYRSNGSYHATTYNGSWNDVATVSTSNNLNLLNGNEFDAAWNGESWMLIQGTKRLFRLTKNGLENYGETRDVFLTIAGNDDGEFLLGGAASEKGRTTPFYPLSAKLVRVIEDGGASDGSTAPAQNENGDGVTDGETGITVWQWLTPNVNEMESNEDVTYTVGAWDADGIDRIQIVVNGDIKRTCAFDGNSGNVECTHTIQANAYPDNTNIYVNAQVWDENGESVWTSGWNVYNRGDANQQTNGSDTEDSGTGISTTISFNPNRTTLEDNESIKTLVEAWDDDGIRRIDIYVNGEVRESCTWTSMANNQTCTEWLYAEDYNANTDIYVNAKVTDGDWNETWTNSRTIRRVGENDSDETGDISVSSWIEGRTTLYPGEAAVFRTEANAADGLERIIVYVDGEPAHTCFYDHAMGTVACGHSIYHQGRADGTVVRARAKAVDENGRYAWGEERMLTIRTTGDANTSGDVSVWDWLEPNTTEIKLHETVTYHPEGWAESGIEQITVLANGRVVRECNYASGSGNRDCWVELDGADYPVNADLFVNARIRARNGAVAWTNGRTIRVYDDGIEHEGNDAHPGTLNVWSNRDQGIGNGQTITVSAYGSDPDGISSLDLYVNAERVKTCSGLSCSVTVGPFDQYPYVTYAARLTDLNGNITWTGYRQVKKW